MTTPPDRSRLPFGPAQGPADYGPPSGAYTPWSYSEPYEHFAAPQALDAAAEYDYPMAMPPSSMPPANSMGWAITAICLGLFISPFTLGWIFGIIGAIRANDVSKRWNLGDYSGAEQAARSAKILSLIGIGITVVLSTLVLVIYLVFIVAGGNLD